MLKFTVVSLAAAALLAFPAVAQDAPPAPDASTEAAGADAGSDRDKVICRTMRAPTGTRVGSSKERKRVCRTKAEWDQAALEAQEAVKFRNNGANTMPRQGGD